MYIKFKYYNNNISGTGSCSNMEWISTLSNPSLRQFLILGKTHTQSKRVFSVQIKTDLGGYARVWIMLSSLINIQERVIQVR